MTLRFTSQSLALHYSYIALHDIALHITVHCITFTLHDITFYVTLQCTALS